MMCELKKPWGLALPDRSAGEMIAAFGPLLVSGLKLFCIDGGNIFNPQPLAKWLRSQGIPHRAVLEHHLFLSRAFTCHQLAGAVDTLLTPASVHHCAGSLHVAVILGVEQMFLDDDIRIGERRYLFGRILARTRWLAARGLPVLVTCGRGSDAAPWVAQVASKTTMISDVRKALPEIRKELTDGQNMANV